MNFMIFALMLLVMLLSFLVLILKTLYVELGVIDKPVNTQHNYHYLPQVPELLLLVFGVTTLVVVYYFQTDFMVADWIYLHSQWILKKSFITNGVLHQFTKVILMAVYLYMLISLLVRARSDGMSQKVYDQGILLLSIGLSGGIVSLLKRFLDVDCPWDLLAYGGDKPFFSLFNYDPDYLPSANCFPSSHASVGFSWIAVYFYFLVTNNPLKNKAFMAALVMGLLFGITQQLRGAHFISHDLTSLLICICTTMAVYSIAYRKKRALRNV